MVCTGLAGVLLAFGTFVGRAHAAPPDSPPDYETLTTGLGIGILYEPSLGAGPDNNLSDAYMTQYGDEFEQNGFTSVRLRLSMDQFTDNSTGTYPNQSLNSAFFTDLEFIVDDLLARNNDTMYVLISPKGLEAGTANDETQMAKWWGEIAVHFQDYTHRLIFNLMNEPLIRVGEYQDLAGVQSLYESITDAIRPTNPTRYLVYHRIHDEYMNGSTRLNATSFSETGPGPTDFNHLDMNAIDHRGYLIFDVHFLGNEDTEGNGEGKRDERLRQTWEFREATGYPVWSGAWNWGAWDTSWSTTEVGELVQLMQDKGIPGTYLMFNSSNTSIYDGNGTDNDNDSIYNEWTKPEYVPIVTSRNPIFWQKDEVHPVTMYAPQHDGYTDSANPSTVDGDNKEIQIDANRTKVAYIKFNVGRVPDGTVTGAKLRLKARTANNDTVSVHLASHSNWDESDDDSNGVPGLDWNAAPSYGSALDSIVVNVADTASSLDSAVNDHDWLDPNAYTHASWYELDVSSAITGPGTYTFALTGSSGAVTDFWSRDSDGTTGSVGTWKYYPRLEVSVNPTAPANNAPVFTADPIVETAGEEGVAYNGTVADDATDADADSLRFGKASGPYWLTVKQDGTLVGTPAAGDVGLNSWIIEVTDAKGGFAATELQITVAEGSGGQQMSDPVPFTVVEDSYAKFTKPTSNYGSSSVLEARLGAGNFGRVPYIKFNVSGITEPVASAILKVYSDTVSAPVTAHATGNGWTEMGITWDNQPGLGSQIGSGTAVAGAWFEIDVTGYVTGNGTYSVALDEQTNTKANLSSREGGNAAVLEIRTWISGGNTAPAFNSNPVVEVNATEDAAYSSTLANDASDADSDPLTFSSIAGPSWLNVAVSGALSGTPANLDVGLNSWTVQVDDGTDTDTAMLNITVDAAPINNPPAFTVDPFSKANAEENVAYSGSIAGDASDPESDPLTFSKVSGPAWLSVAADGTLSGTPGAGDVGANAFTVQVDATGGNDTATLDIMVDAAPSGPAFIDNFESSADWTSEWTSHGAWARKTARAHDGSYSAEIDGNVTDSALVSRSIDVTGKSSVTITFWWFIEKGLDTGEYLAFDTDTGSGFVQQATRQGNVDQENTWASESIVLDVSGTNTLTIRFRGKMNNSKEDAYVDQVEVVAQ
jgi:hypothetical protein